MVKSRRVFIELGVRIEVDSDRDLGEWAMELPLAVQQDLAQTFREAGAAGVEIDVFAANWGEIE